MNAGQSWGCEFKGPQLRKQALCYEVAALKDCLTSLHAALGEAGERRERTAHEAVDSQEVLLPTDDVVSQSSSSSSSSPATAMRKEVSGHEGLSSGDNAATVAARNGGGGSGALADKKERKTAAGSPKLPAPGQAVERALETFVHVAAAAAQKRAECEALSRETRELRKELRNCEQRRNAMSTDRCREAVGLPGGQSTPAATAPATTVTLASSCWHRTPEGKLVYRVRQLDKENDALRERVQALQVQLCALQTRKRPGAMTRRTLNRGDGGTGADAAASPSDALADSYEAHRKGCEENNHGRNHALSADDSDDDQGAAALMATFGREIRQQQRRQAVLQEALELALARHRGRRAAFAYCCATLSSLPAGSNGE